MPPAQSAIVDTYYVYWDRSEVKMKAGVIGALTFACNFAPWGISNVCSGGAAGAVFDYAALKRCKVRQRVQITDSPYSWDRARHTYWPYHCLG